MSPDDDIGGVFFRSRLPGGVTLLEMSGRFGHLTAWMVRLSLRRASVDGAPRLIVDLTDVVCLGYHEEIDLMSGLVFIRNHDQDVVLVCESGDRYESFHRNRFAVYRDIASAHAQLAPGADVDFSAYLRPRTTDQHGVGWMTAAFAIMVGLGVYAAASKK